MIVLAKLIFNVYLTSGAGTDEDAILMLLTSRSNDQRQEIKAAYKRAYGKVRRATVNRELLTDGSQTDGWLDPFIILSFFTPRSW